MLIEFSVSNFRSIKERAVLSMVANSDCAYEDTHLMQSEALKNHRLLRTAVIYGPNASGKSNILQAFSTMRRLVLYSAESRLGTLEKVESHLFDVDTAGKPSEFEAIFIENGVRYQYGFLVDKERIYEEWLYASPFGRSRLMMKRSYAPADSKANDDGYIVEFGRDIRGTKKNWEGSARQDMLLLSVAYHFKGNDFEPVVQWFKKSRVYGVNALDPAFTMSAFSKYPEYQKRIVKALRDIDLGIKDISVRREKIPWQSDISEELKKNLDKEEDRAFAHHSVIGGSDISLDMNEESAGTRKVFSLIGPLIDIFNRGCLVFIDELSDRLHPLLLSFIVKKFNNPEINKYGAQLIFTSHDTALMSPDYLRRDQIWFIEKNKENASVLYSLMDFKGRQDDDFEREYLSGQYGALPFLREIVDSMGTDYE